MKFKPSMYQQRIFDFVTNGTGNAVVDAVAGSGKSTTIIEALKLIPSDKKILFLAFNKSIVEELRGKTSFIENVDVLTLHSLGARAVCRELNAKIDGNKYTAKANEIAEQFKEDFEEPSDLLDYKRNIRTLIDLVRVNLCTSVDQFQGLANKHGLSLLANEIDVVVHTVRWGYVNTQTIDFTDMIYFPVKKNIPMPKYDWVFVDECQDMNAAQRELFLKCIRKGGRFIAVGDPKQSIYGFAGADAFSFKILTSIENTTTLPLSVCYRCDAEIIKLAQNIVPQIEARENAPQGVVDYNAHVDSVESGDMILCRFTAPLVAQCMDYISRGIKAHVKGRDIGAGLISLVKKTGWPETHSMLRALENDLNRLCDRIIKQQNCSASEAREQQAYKSLEDRVEAVRLISHGLEFTEEVIEKISRIFKDDESTGIVLSTIHKSKGLEADRVFILHPDRIRDSRAEHIEWMAEQEENLEYVAYTRAKNYLGFINN